MGKNDDVLIVSVGEGALPELVEVIRAEIAQNLLKFAPANNGPSFPGLNLPTPLRTLDSVPAEELTPAIENLLALGKNKSASAAALNAAIARLYELSAPRAFADSQKNQFQRSCGEMVMHLREKLSSPPLGLANFQRLLALVDSAKPTLPAFAKSLAEKLVSSGADYDRYALLLCQQVLFGMLDWKKRAAQFGTTDYWKEKAKQDKQPKYARQPIYFDLAFLDSGSRIARPDTGELFNQALLKADAALPHGQKEGGKFGIDAYSGDSVELQDKFPSPKVAELGQVKLFSVNTKEVQALHRYGLGGSDAFPVSSALVQRMNDALLYLADDRKRGSTCRAIPSARAGKSDLLIAYLEGVPEGRTQLAEMFGGEAESFSDADFSAIAKPVIQMLEGELAANADLAVHLLAFSSLDPGRRQISLNRSLRVRDVIRAARDWEAGASNVPPVSVWFYDKSTKQSVCRSHTAPCPLELASVVNRVWSADAKSGFSSTYQRALSVGDAYDVFLADAPLAQQKAKLAMELLITRMRSVLIALGAAKTAPERSPLSEPVRWQSVKTIALLGILLHQLGHDKKNFMQEPITQIGRLLALSDSLHFQYCKFVRTSEEKRKVGKVDAPSELIGNALFNTALDQPVSALARLAERIKPYKGWADTYSGEDAGLIHWLNRQMADARQGIDLEKLPARMTDADKAKLLLGYLADHPKTETPKQ